MEEKISVRFKAEDADGRITFDSLCEALGQAVTLSLFTSGDTRKACRDVIRWLGDVADRFLGRFERNRIADEVALRAQRAFGRGGRVEDAFEIIWPSDKGHYCWTHGTIRKGARWVEVSVDAELRAERYAPCRKFAAVPVAEVEALAASDWDAEKAMRVLNENWRAAVAQVDHHIARFGIDEVRRRISAFDVEVDEVVAA